MLLLDLLVHRKQALDDRAQHVLVEQAPHMVAELSADRAREQQADLLEQAADLVLQIATDADQARPGNEQRSDCLAVVALDPDLTIPAQP